MYRCRFILIVVMAILTASFSIELPFTQVNYIHLLVNKKERGITNALKDAHRLHKTYYEEPGNIVPAAVVSILPPVIRYIHRAVDDTDQAGITCTTIRPNTLRGPPAFS